jgi:hypothetical protein
MYKTQLILEMKLKNHMRNISFCPSDEIHSLISNLGKAYQEKGNKDAGKDCFTNVSILQPEFLSKTTSIINNHSLKKWSEEMPHIQV